MSENSKPQLHQLLAVQKDRAAQANRIMAETKHVLSKADIFQGLMQETVHFAEDDQRLDKTESFGVGFGESPTVEERLKYTGDKVAPQWDAVFQLDKTNQTAKADIVVDGQVIVADVPATTLLTLEEKLKAIRETFAMAPTLDIKQKWTQVDGQKPGVMVAEQKDVRTRTRKVTKPVIMWEPPDSSFKQPAQVEQAVEDVAIATITSTAYSSCISSARKAEILERIEKLTLAVRVARSKANKAEIVKGQIGKPLFDFILA